jgi:hypothetical protein
MYWLKKGEKVEKSRFLYNLNFSNVYFGDKHMEYSGRKIHRKPIFRKEIFCLNASLSNFQTGIQ